MNNDNNAHSTTAGLVRRRVARAVAVIALTMGGVYLCVSAWLWANSAVPQRSLEQWIDDPSEALEKGAYLARAGNCVSCHTVEGGMEFSGGVPFYTDFGVLYSTNITPDSSHGIGQWSFEDFYASMKNGVRPNGEHLYPAFPYTDFALVSEQDLAYLFVYLKNLEPSNSAPPKNELTFPFSLRPTLAFWKLLFHDPEPQLDADLTELVARGEYLVEGLGHCGACHTPRNVLGAEQPELALTGGMQVHATRLQNLRLWSAVNLTPHEAGLGSWTEQDLTQYLHTGKSDKAVVHGPMTEVIINSLSRLTERDTNAMASYLKTLEAKAQPIQASVNAQEDLFAEGEVVYTVHCGSCHLPDAAGAEGLGVPLKHNPIVQAPGPESLINTILYGPHLPARPFSVDRSNMSMFGKRLSNQDIASLATYLRNSFGNAAGAVTASQVQAQR
ncbi:cytochrome c [Halioxenophilus aromaticivorans]